MSEVTSYASGTPCWIDGTTPDLAAGRAFYTGLFGWTFEDMGEEAGHYNIAKLRDLDVAGFMTLNDEMKAMGVPPAWTTYFATDDADASAKQITAAGGSLMVEPVDVMDLGRMAVAADPTGAVFGLWQPRSYIGSRVVNEAGTLCWNQLNTRDIAGAATFYADVLGATFEGPDDYRELVVGDRHVAGAMTMPPQMPAEVSAHWLTYFAVDDTETTVAKAQELGGSIVAPPMDIDAGRIAVIVDPAGAAFGVIKLTNPPA